jgi:hypothetical protein
MFLHRRLFHVDGLPVLPYIKKKFTATGVNTGAANGDDPLFESL